MQLLKLAIPLTASLLFFGCTSQAPQTQSSPSPTPFENTLITYTTPLQEAVKELQVLEKKIKGGIDDKGYSVIIAKIQPLVEKASGEAKAVAATKSAFEGHQLALKFWQCDRVEGYEELYQCRGKVLAKIFGKYPGIKAQAKAAVEGKDLSAVSRELDKEGLLQAIWKKTSVDTEAARRAISPDTTQKKRQQ